MKKILFIFSLILIFSSCSSLNYEQRTKELDLGMTKQEVLNIMGKDYYIESLSETDKGKIEVLTFYENIKENQKFTLYFLNNRLKEFHKYKPPHMPHDVRILSE